MSDEGKPIKPEHLFKRIIWRSMIAIGAHTERFTTWTITGVAAIVGLIISHLDSVRAIVTTSGLRWTIILFAFSILAGVISKQIGMAVAGGLEIISKMEATLYSEDGKRLLGSMTINPNQLMSEIAEPFLWPLSLIVRRGGSQGVTDYSAGEKRFIRLFCIQLYFNFAHGLLAAAAIILLALSIH